MILIYILLSAKTHSFALEVCWCCVQFGYKTKYVIYIKIFSIKRWQNDLKCVIFIWPLHIFYHIKYKYMYMVIYSWIINIFFKKKMLLLCSHYKDEGMSTMNRKASTCVKHSTFSCIIAFNILLCVWSGFFICLLISRLKKWYVNILFQILVLKIKAKLELEFSCHICCLLALDVYSSSKFHLIYIGMNNPTCLLLKPTVAYPETVLPDWF